MTPICITAHLYSGFVSSDPWSPSIDGIIAYWHLRARDGDELFSLRAGRPDLIEPVEDLPLARVEHAGTWWYACSSPIFTAQAQVRRYLHRRFDAVSAERYMPEGARKVQVQAGPYKNSRIGVVHRITDRITWHVVGDLDAIRPLLDQCRHVGAKIGAGFGRVRGWEYGSGDEDLARHHRPLPVAYAAERGIDGDLMDWGIKPPARLASHVCQCVMPCAG